MLSEFSIQWAGGLVRAQAKHGRTGAMSYTPYPTIAEVG